VGNSSPSATSQKSQTPFPPDAFNPWLTIATLLGVPLVVIAVGMIFLLATRSQGAATSSQALEVSLRGVHLLIVVEIAAVVYLFLVLPYLAKTSLRRLGFRSLTLSDIGYIAAATLAMVVVTNGTASLLQAAFHTKVNEAAMNTYLSMKTPLAKAQFALLGVLVAAVFEETLFRFLIFNAVRKWSGFWTGAIVSGALFGLAHLQAAPLLQNIELALPLGLGGVLLCAVYAKTRNAYAPIVTHGIFNAVTLVALLFAPQLAK